IGTINLDIFKSVSDDITTDKVIFNSDRIEHVKKDHPGDYESFSIYIATILKNPDYIIKANRPKSAVLLSKIMPCGTKLKLVLRLNTSSDPPEYKNSIITFMKIRDKEWRRITKSRNVLYISPSLC
ncbi:MAG: PBECR2 nuclease fold domain-containing protein, partial [Oscillospiraceae bacterium]|nr:PBECR2 nuclease fold domain-containing protein [Oscillospiraceae bacterium]